MANWVAFFLRKCFLPPEVWWEQWLSSSTVVATVAYCHHSAAAVLKQILFSVIFRDVLRVCLWSVWEKKKTMAKNETVVAINHWCHHIVLAIRPTFFKAKKWFQLRGKMQDGMANMLVILPSCVKLWPLLIFLMPFVGCDDQISAVGWHALHLDIAYAFACVKAFQDALWHLCTVKMVILRICSNWPGKKCPRVPGWVGGGGPIAIWAMPNCRARPPKWFFP